ncbi:MAG: tRNA preQ1(34) S-adenosylmethionine ribosyltransferase-isomerase QueA [Betaproteobacteria bacterium]|nr:tRNA preQ1(34) S-adenosylmethionine ribosyltransferase-isomerase QueA [Betaproteobacteria bacterium]
MNLSDFDFHLPPELIAQRPAAQRIASRLLHLNGHEIVDRHFHDLPALLQAGDLLVFNDTKVIKARLHGYKETGGQIEVLIERIVPNEAGLPHHALAHIRASKSPKPGTRLQFADGVTATMLARVEDLFELDFGADTYDILARCGEVPLPPYITNNHHPEDEARYQTVYAKYPGSVAAPTAGLHFDEALLETLRERGIGQAFVTLHVGAGTFRPVRDDDISKHIMHSERYHVPEETVRAVQQTQQRGGRVIAVGTTSLRTLESASQGGSLLAGAGETRLFITPGYRFKTVDRLITNFHLPKSTLLMLVSAFAGHENVMRAYAHAVAEKYRFFSYGDAMWVTP